MIEFPHFKEAIALAGKEYAHAKLRENKERLKELKKVVKDLKIPRAYPDQGDKVVVNKKVIDKFDEKLANSVVKKTENLMKYVDNNLRQKMLMVDQMPFKKGNLVVKKKPAKTDAGKDDGDDKDDGQDGDKPDGQDEGDDKGKDGDDDGDGKEKNDDDKNKEKDQQDENGQDKGDKDAEKNKNNQNKNSKGPDKGKGNKDDKKGPNDQKKNKDNKKPADDGADKKDGEQDKQDDGAANDPPQPPPNYIPILIPLPTSPREEQAEKKDAATSSNGIDPFLIRVNKLDPIRMPKNDRNTQFQDLLKQIDEY